MASYFLQERRGKLGGIKDISFDNIAKKKVLDSVKCMQLFSDEQSQEIEKRIDKMVLEADEGMFKHRTVDRAPLRTKYFFGEGYSYGGQLKVKGPGQERLYPFGEVDPIPSWIKSLIVKPLEDAGIVPPDWTNSAVVNDYLPGGCIVSHVDPPQLFDRPIITASFHSDSAISFGCKFSFKPIQVSPPVARVPLARGCVLSMGPGYSTDEITHCIRPEDVKERRSVVILRHVPNTAPRMTRKDLEDLQRAEQFKHGNDRHAREEIHRMNSRTNDIRRNTASRRRSISRSRSRSRIKRRSRSRQRPRKKHETREKAAQSRTPQRSKDRENNDHDHQRRVVRMKPSESPDYSSPSSPETCRKSSASKMKTSKPSVPGFVAKILLDPEKEDGELSPDEKVDQTVTEIMKTSSLDKEEAAFQKRLEKLKSNLSNKIEKTQKTEDCSSSSSDESVANDQKSNEGGKAMNDDPALISEVSQLKKELKELKEVIGNITNKTNKNEPSELGSNSEESDDDSRAVNVVDIISKEVKTTILSKNKETKITKATYLKIKAERKEKLLKSKLIELKQKSSQSDFKKSSKSQNYRKNNVGSWEIDSSDSEPDSKAKSLLDIYRKRLERKMKEKMRKKTMQGEDDRQRYRGHKLRDGKNERTRQRKW